MKLIDESFLLSHGWKENNRKVELSHPETHFTIVFRDGEIYILDEYGFHDGMRYSGPIPTEEQFEVLNQLLKMQ